MCDKRAKRIFNALWQGGACAVVQQQPDRLPGRTSLLQFFIVAQLSCFFEKALPMPTPSRPRKQCRESFPSAHKNVPWL
jgi:hypothetical protein